MEGGGRGLGWRGKGDVFVIMGRERGWRGGGGWRIFVFGKGARDGDAILDKVAWKEKFIGIFTIVHLLLVAPVTKRTPEITAELPSQRRVCKHLESR